MLSTFRDTTPLESEFCRIEAIKALANMHYQPAEKELEQQGHEHPIASLRMMCHDAADFLAGKKTPFTPPRAPFVAETTIQVETDGG
jgi:hypothetical protein